MISLSVEEKTLLGLGIFNAFLIFVFLIHYLIVYNVSRKKSLKYANSSIDSGDIDLSSPSSSTTTTIKEGDNKEFRYIEYKNKRNYTALIIESLASLVIFQLLILVLVMFDVLPISAGIIIMFIIAFIYWIVWIMPTPDQLIKSTIGFNFFKKFFKRHFYKFKPRYVKENGSYWFSLLPVLLAILLLTILLEGTCEDELSFIDSRIIRKYMTPTCQGDGTPCFIYLTLNQQPSTSIIANFHTSLSDFSDENHPIPICYYGTKTIGNNDSNINKYDFNTTGEYYKMPIEVSRYVNWVHLEELTPKTTYFFRCGTKENGYSMERKFKTQSSSEDDEYSFVVGGDVDVTEKAVKISEIAAKSEPDFAMIGGDLAYDHAQYTCYRIVDKWLNNWQFKMITPLGYTIPIIASIGNHEVIGDYNAPSSRIPFFLRYFPQMLKSNDPGSKGNQIDDRLSYNDISIGGSKGTVIFNLDSGHHSSLSEQANWINQLMDTKYNETQLRFSIYHVPMYPTIREYSNTRSAAVRDNWLSIFDKYHFNIGFENHDHAYKRTLPLNNNQIINDDNNNNNNTKSTIYIGDGAWGTGIRPLTSSTLKWYQSFSKSTHYITSISINPIDKLINFKSIDIDEIIFDQGVVKY